MRGLEEARALPALTRLATALASLVATGAETVPITRGEAEAMLRALRLLGDLLQARERGEGDGG